MQQLQLIWELFYNVSHLLCIVLAAFYLYKAVKKRNELNGESTLLDLADFIKIGWSTLVLLLLAVSF